MTPEQLAKVKDVLAKHGLIEQRMAKKVYIKDDGSHISADLRGEKPIVGMMINDTVEPDGNSNAEITQMQNEVEAIMKSKTIPTSKSPVSEQKGSNPASGDTPLKAGKMAGLGTQKQEEIKKGTTTAICQACKCIFEGTIDTFRDIQDKYGVIFCPKCSEDADGKHEAKEDPPKSGAKIPMCRKCGIEVSHARALACLGNDEPCMCEDCGEKQNEPEVKEKIMDEKLPAKQEAKLPAKKTDAQIDEMIELAKAEKFLKGQGGSYTVSGKNRPDSAMVQKIANAADISSEILFAEQTKDYAHVVVRGHLGDIYVDAVVHHDFETEFQLQTMEIIKKNPQILDHYEGLIPVIKEGATIILSDKQVDAKYHLIHTLLSFKTFSLRDATTKAMQIVQSKLLNQDPRTKEEVASEQKERDLVEEKRNQKR